MGVVVETGVVMDVNSVSIIPPDGREGNGGGHRLLEWDLEAQSRFERLAREAPETEARVAGPLGRPGGEASYAAGRLPLGTEADVAWAAVGEAPAPPAQVPLPRAPGRRIRVLVAEDHPQFAEAIRSALSLDGRIDVVGRARNGREAVQLSAVLEPDVVVMDLEMPLLDGIEATRHLRSTDGPVVVMLTTCGSRAEVGRALEAGVSAFVRKDEPFEHVVDAIIAVAMFAGQPVF
jgi:CheY-like chemotaxis protein